MARVGNVIEYDGHNFVCVGGPAKQSVGDKKPAVLMEWESTCAYPGCGKVFRYFYRQRWPIGMGAPTRTCEAHRGGLKPGRRARGGPAHTVEPVAFAPPPAAPAPIVEPVAFASSAPAASGPVPMHMRPEFAAGNSTIRDMASVTAGVAFKEALMKLPRDAFLDAEVPKAAGVPDEQQTVNCRRWEEVLFARHGA